VYSSVVQLELIYHYARCKRCKFTVYETLVVAADIIMITLLIFGLYLILTQKLRGLRIYVMILFLATWLQLLLILLLTQRYPIAHDVHFSWQNRRSLEKYENKFACCGVLGPDDYLLSTGKLPRSCFRNQGNSTDDLHDSGCLNKENGSATILRIEFLTTLFQMILVLFALVFYLHLKKMKAKPRTLREVWQSRIIL
ncbi:hypothetical protein KR093_006915, partial [Drosophila rubida]